MSDTTTKRKTVPHRIDQINQLQIGDEIVFARRSLDDDEIDSKRPLEVVDKASRVCKSTHEDEFTGAEAYETRQYAVEVSGDWAGARTYVLADATNSLDGSHAGLVDYDSGVMVEIARVGCAESAVDDGGREEVPA